MNICRRVTLVPEMPYAEFDDLNNKQDMTRVHELKFIVVLCTV